MCVCVCVVCVWCGVVCVRLCMHQMCGGVVLVCLSRLMWDDESFNHTYLMLIVDG